MNRPSMLTALTALAALALSPVSSSPASATTPVAAPVITSTTLTAWDLFYDGTVELDGTTPVDKALRNKRTVSGTSTGTTGDFLKVYCVTKGAAHDAVLGANVPVNVDGSWTLDTSTEAVRAGITSERISCRLAVAWVGAPVPAYDSVSGLEVHIVRVSPDVANGAMDKAWVEYRGTDGYMDFDASGYCSLCDSYSANPATGYANGIESALFWWNSALYGQWESESLLTVDGNAAWSGYNINRELPLSPVDMRAVQTTVSLDRTTGVLTYTEVSPLGRCYVPGPLHAALNTSACYGTGPREFVRTGVTLTRVTTLMPDGQSYYVDDTFTSNDGQSHVVNVRYLESYITDVGTNNVTDIKFPAGVSGVSGNTWIDGGAGANGKTITGLGSKTVTVNLAVDYNNPPSYTNPIGAIVYSAAPDQMRTAFGGWLITEYLNKTVDATHNINTGANYVQASSQASLDTRVAAAVDEISSYLPASNLTWSAQTAVRQSTKSLSALASSNGGAIRYSVVDGGTTGCSINATTGAVSFTGGGTCVVRATSAHTDVYSATHKDLSLSVAPMCTLGAAANVMFSSDTAGLSNAAKTQLRSAAANLIADGCTKITITGDGPMTVKKAGSLAARKLSALKRANAVKLYLAGQFAAAKKRVTITVKASVRADSAAVDKTAAAAKAHMKATVSAKL